MNIATAENVLLWCTLINYGLMVVWFLIMVLPHEWLYRCWARWFRLSDQQFDVVSFAGIALHKVLILMFNLVPYVALLFAG
jgi:hypothetical protein